MKVGDVIKVCSVLDGVHPVGIVMKVVEDPQTGAQHMMCLFLDGDYEPLSYETDFEVINESR